MTTDNIKLDVSVGDTLYSLDNGHRLTVQQPGRVGDWVRAKNEVTGYTDWLDTRKVRRGIFGQAASPSGTITIGQTGQIGSSPPPDSGEWNEALLRLAAQYDQVVEFTYRKPDGSVTERSVVPTSVFTASNGHVIVAAEDEGADEPRCFRLDRIDGFVGVST